MYTVQSGSFLVQHIGQHTARPAPYLTFSLLTPPTLLVPSVPRVLCTCLTSEHFLMPLGLPGVPSFTSSALPGKLRGCLLWHIFPCLLAGRIAHSALATLCQVLGFARRWLSHSLAYPAQYPWWISSRCTKPVLMNGLVLVGRPWSLCGPCGPCLHHLLPPLSFLVMASGPDSSELAGNLAADARRCEGGFS